MTKRERKYHRLKGLNRICKRYGYPPELLFGKTVFITGQRYGKSLLTQAWAEATKAEKLKIPTFADVRIESYFHRKYGLGVWNL